ncbi:cupin domain-containing protein [Halorubrum sp. JWXQ-INN 858]|uniref:cupin domain-containing protein n=1 Tax=Halorubrum sp. JWXQ-INN 858 TaxID=2690782 RepID=UPI0013585E67|nr:cupin domain-containing protein [Halorubrum sp. JWXQ-INN 858]MWV64085.1 cupin domain-containing protein [Halorubrum sp. JWXQ-INN 858]
MSQSVPRKNGRQWVESRGGREVTVTEHPVRAERVTFYNEPDDPAVGPLTLTFSLGVGHEVGVHAHPKQTETISVNEGRLRATVDGIEHALEVGDTVTIDPGTPHGYEVVGDDEVVLAVSMTPGLAFKEFVLAEHALAPEDYGDHGLNLPYLGLVSRRYGPMIAPPQSGLRLTLLLGAFTAVGRAKRLRIPDEPLPVRDGDGPET